MQQATFAVPRNGNELMIRCRPSPCGIAFWASALVLAIVALAAQPCAAQPADSGLKILFSETAHDPAPTITNLRLRPNASQQFYLYVRNTGKAAREAIVELRAGAKAVPGTRAEVKIPVGTTQISLPKPPAPAPGEKPPGPTALPAPLRVRLLDPKTNKPL